MTQKAADHRHREYPARIVPYRLDHPLELGYRYRKEPPPFGQRDFSASPAPRPEARGDLIDDPAETPGSVDVLETLPEPVTLLDAAAPLFTW